MKISLVVKALLFLLSAALFIIYLLLPLIFPDFYPVQSLGDALRYLVLLVPSFITTIAWLYVLAADYLDELQKQRENEKYFKEIRKFLSSELSIPTKHVDIPTRVMSRNEAYSCFIGGNFPQLSEVEVKSLCLAAFCHYYDISGAVDSVNFYDLIQTYSSSMRLYNVGPSARTFLTVYHNVFKLGEKQGSIQAVFRSHGLAKEDFKELLRDYVTNFWKDGCFIFIIDMLNQEKELRETLIELIEKGELSAYGVNEESIKKLEEELKKAGDYARTFLVIGNKIDQRIKEYITEQPGFGGWAPLSRNIPDNGRRQFSAYIFRPRGNFNSAEDIVERVIKPMTKEEEGDSLIFVVPLDFINSKIFSVPPDRSFSSKNLQESYDVLNYFSMGYSRADVDVWSILTKSEIGVSHLLSILPFNVIVPDIYKSEREFIIKNYQKLKGELEVETLTDWAKKSPIHIREALLSCGRPNYSPIEKKSIFDIDDGSGPSEYQIRGRMEYISKKVVDNAGKYAKSLKKIYSKSLEELFGGT
jgi:hypothetical protein